MFTYVLRTLITVFLHFSPSGLFFALLQYFFPRLFSFFQGSINRNTNKRGRVGPNAANPTSAVETVKLLIFHNLRSKVVTTNCVFQIFAANSVLAFARGYAGEYPVSLRAAI